MSGWSPEEYIAFEHMHNFEKAIVDLELDKQIEATGSLLAQASENLQFLYIERLNRHDKATDNRRIEYNKRRSAELDAERGESL